MHYTCNNDKDGERQVNLRNVQQGPTTSI